MASEGDGDRLGARLQSAFRRSELARSSLSLFTSDVAAGVLTFAFLLLVARAGGPTTRGVMAFITTLPVLLSHASTLGLNSANLYFLRREPQLKQALIVTSLVVGLVVGALLALVAWAILQLRPGWVPGSVSQALLSLGLASTSFLTAQILLEAALIGDRHINPVNLLRVAMPLISIAVFVALSLRAGGADGTAAVVAWLAGRFAGFVGSVVYSVRRIGIAGLEGVRRTLKPLLRYGLPAHAGLLADLPLRRFDTLVLGASAGAAQVGIYTVAVNVSELLLYLPRTATSVLLPSGATRSDRDARRLTRQMVLVVTGTGTLVAAAGLLLADPIVRLLFGKEFAASGVPLRILLIAMIGMSIRWTLSTGLSARGRPGLASAAAAPTMLAVVALDLLLIPPFGVAGAAWASLVAYWVGALILFVVDGRARGAGPAGPGAGPEGTPEASPGV